MIAVLWIFEFLKTQKRKGGFTRILFLSIVVNAHAQEPAFKFQRLTSENGLANSVVQTIMQDSRGFIWFGTSGGLHKFDGYDFEVFRHQENNISSISDNIIVSIFEDRNGILWIGTRDGLNKLEPGTGLFTTYKSGFGKDSWLTDKSIRWIYEDKEGYLWLAISEIGLVRFDKTRGLFDKVFQYTEGKSTGLSSNHIKVILEDQSGNFWLGSDNGLTCFDRFKEAFKTYLPSADGKNSLPHRHIKSMCQDSKGNFWIGTDGGLSYAERRGSEIVSFTNYSHTESNPATISSNLVKSVIEDSHGMIWIATDDGLNIFNPTDHKFKHIRHDQTNPWGLVNNFCRFILEDRQGIIWIATDGGISKFDPGAFPFKLYRHDPIKENSLSSDFTNAVFEDQKGILWIGTTDGLNKYDATKNKFQVYRSYPGIETSISNNFITAIREDRNGILWVGTDQGLNRFDSRKGSFKKFVRNNEDPASLAHEGILSLLVDRRNALWVGTWNGLEIFDTLNNSFNHFHPEIINERRIQALFEDDAGQIWIGARGKLLSVDYDKVGNEIIKTYQHNFNDSTSVSSNNITAFCQVATDCLWIGTGGGGLNYFDKRTGKFQHFTWDDGLPSDNINAIEGDENGNLWISTDKGLCKFNTATRQFTRYDINDGLQGNAFNYGASCKAKNGKMYFGGINGLNAFFPDSIRPNDYSPAIYINSFQLFNKRVGTGKRITPKAITELSSLELTHEDKVFTLGFVALNYRNSSKNLYSYKMENFDRDWTITDSERRFATYTNLAPGNYTFRVRTANNDGVWGKEEATLKIVILPPYWQTWWFYSLCIIGIVSLLAMISWLRMRNLRIAKAHLKMQVELRTNELTVEKENLETAYRKITDQKDEIEAQKEHIDKDRKRLEEAQIVIQEQNSQLQLSNSRLEDEVQERTRELKATIEKMVDANNELDFFVYRAAHDLRGPIVRLEGLCHVGQMEKDSTEAYKYLKRVERVSREMNKMLSRLLRTRSINKHEIRLRDLNINQTVRKILSGVIEAEQAKDVSIDVSIPPDARINSDPELIDTLLENVILNSIRYRDVGKNSYLRIGTTPVDEGKIMISIEDNGIGIPPELRQSIFEMFFIGTERSNGFGLGLYEAKLITKRLRGSINLNFTRNDVTEVQIILPSGSQLK